MASSCPDAARSTASQLKCPRRTGSDWPTWIRSRRSLVRTQNSVYQIVVVQPRRKAVLVRGGPFFPQATRAVLSGSNFGGSMLKVAWVGIGLHMEFHAEDQWVITSRVQSITVQPERALPGPF